MQPLLTRRPMVIATMVAGICAVALARLPHQLGLIVATLAGVGAGVAASSNWKGRL